MTYEIVVSKAVTDIIGDVFSVCGCLLIGIGFVATARFVYTLSDDVLPLPLRILISVLLIFIGSLVVSIVILETLGIITIVRGI